MYGNDGEINYEDLHGRSQSYKNQDLGCVYSQYLQYPDHIFSVSNDDWCASIVNTADKTDQSGQKLQHTVISEFSVFCVQRACVHRKLSALGGVRLAVSGLTFHKITAVLWGATQH